jgi:hypothetical protein
MKFIHMKTLLTLLMAISLRSFSQEIDTMPFKSRFEEQKWLNMPMPTFHFWNYADIVNHLGKDSTVNQLWFLIADTSKHGLLPTYYTRGHILRYYYNSIDGWKIGYKYYINQFGDLPKNYVIILERY